MKKSNYGKGLMKTLEVEMVSKMVLTALKWLIDIFNLLGISVTTEFFFTCLCKRKFGIIFLLLSPSDLLIFFSLCPRRLASIWFLLDLASEKTQWKVRDWEERGWMFILLLSPGRSGAVILHPRCCWWAFLLWL